jgi:hypothetical protein
VGSFMADVWLEVMDVRKDAGTEIRPFLSILLTNVDKNKAIQLHIPLLWDSMGWYGSQWGFAYFTVLILTLLYKEKY